MEGHVPHSEAVAPKKSTIDDFTRDLYLSFGKGLERRDRGDGSPYNTHSSLICRNQEFLLGLEVIKQYSAILWRGDSGRLQIIPKIESCL